MIYEKMRKDIEKQYKEESDEICKKYEVKR